MRASLPHEDAPPVDALELAFTLSFASIAAVSCVVVGLAWLGHLRVVPLALLAALACVVATACVIRSWRRTRASRVARPTPRSMVAILLITALGSVLFFKPAEYVFDGADASVYLAVGDMLATHGTVTPPETLTTSWSDADRRALFPDSPSPGLPMRFPGGIQMTARGDQLRPDFFHLFPAWLASASLLFGPWARWYVNPMLALGSVIALWLLGRRLSGALTGEIAAGLLMVNVAQVWFARVPSSEMTAQFLVLAGLYLMLVALDTGWIVAAACAGAAFGLLGFARIDMLVLVTPAVVILLALASRVNGVTRQAAWAAAPFAALTLIGLVYALTNAERYTRQVTSMLSAYVMARPGTLIVAGAGLLVVIGMLGILRRSRPVPRVAWGAVGVTALSLVVFLLWRDSIRGQFLHLVSPLGVAIGIGGLVALLMRSDGHRALPIALMFLVATAYLRHPMDDRVLPGAFRRYLPMLLPMVLLGVAYAVQALRGRRRFGTVVLLVPWLFGAWLAWHTWPIVARPVMRFGAAELAKVAAVTEPASLLVWDAGTPSHLALAAHTSLRRESIVVPYGADSGPAIRRVVGSTLAQGRSVYLVIDQRQGTARAQPWRERFHDLEIVPGPSVELGAEYLFASAGRFPFRVHRGERRLDFYLLQPLGAGSSAGLPFRIDVGDRDLPYLLEGFYPAERHGDTGETTVRWTGAIARLRMPSARVPAGTRVRIVLRLATHRPDGVPVTLDVEVNGRPIDRLRVGSAWAHYEILLDAAAVQGAAELTFRSDTFVPRDSGMGADARVLGVLLDWISVEAVPSG